MVSIAFFSAPDCVPVIRTTPGITLPSSAPFFGSDALEEVYEEYCNTDTASFGLYTASKPIVLSSDRNLGLP